MLKYHTMFSVGFLGGGGERLTYAEHFLDLLLIFFFFKTETIALSFHSDIVPRSSDQTNFNE